MTQRGDKKLALRLAPFETHLLEFGKDGVDAGKVVCPQTVGDTSMTLTNWHLSFPKGWGTPTEMKLDRLVPWKDLPGVSEEGRSFSGTATYTTTVNLAARPNGALWLDLGDVRDYARVFVNGREAAALWAQPYSCDIAPYAKQGCNEIRVDVTSTWFNRLAYDFNQPPEKRKTWTIWNIPRETPPCLKPNAALRESGLLGPVVIFLQGK